MFTYKQIKNLNDLEFSVYNYVMENKSKVRYMKIRELAEEAHVSTTTVLHFCKKMDCDGYSEFKLKFKMYLEEGKEARVSDDNTELVDFLKKTNVEEFEQRLNAVTRILLDTERTIFLGTGSSGIVAKYGARYFSSVGLFSLYIDDPDYPTAGHFYEKAVVVVVSVSGETKDVIGHVSRLKRHDCIIISITNTENCTLAKMSDLNLAYYVPYIRTGIYDITTQIPAMHILERIGRKIYNYYLSQDSVSLEE